MVRPNRPRTTADRGHDRVQHSASSRAQGPFLYKPRTTNQPKSAVSRTVHLFYLYRSQRLPPTLTQVALVSHTYKLQRVKRTG